MFIGQQSGSSVPTIDDILRFTQCKLLMPFVNDFLDHSLYRKNTGILTGTLSVGENGAIFTRTQNMFIDCDLNVSEDYTIEILITITNDTHEAYFLGGQGSNTFYLCYTNNTKSFYFGRHGYNAVKDTSTVIELNKMYHVALVMDKGYYKAYINGKQVTSVDVNSAKPTANTTRIYLGRPYTDLNSTAYSLDGIVGGLKITSKALQPSEFSLTRPFKIPEINYKQGNKTYLYKDGVLDPRIILPADIVNDPNLRCLRWNKQGTTYLNIDLLDLKGKNLFIKYWMDNLYGSATAYVAVCNSSGVIKSVPIRPATESLNTKNYMYAGIDGADQQSTMYRISGSVYVEVSFRVYEIWYE